MRFRLKDISILFIAVAAVLVLSGCNQTDNIDLSSSALSLPEDIQATQEIENAQEAAEPDPTFPQILLRLDLNVPPEERKWETQALRTQKSELSISDIMWLLRGSTDLENLPEVATIAESGYAHTLNITSPEFMGDESLYINACTTYFIHSGQGYHARLTDLADIFVEYFGEPATDLPIYSDGAFQFPYYFSSREEKRTDEYGYERLIHVENAGGPGIWLPRELWAVQEKARVPIITETPYEATPPIFFDADLPDEWAAQLNRLSNGQKAQIKEMYSSSDPVKNKLQGYLTRVMPDLLRVGDEAPIYFSEPSEASTLFVQETALRFAEYSGWDKYHEFEDFRNVYGEIAPVADIAREKYGILGVDVGTAAKEIFGNIEVRQSQLNASWSKALFYNKYMNIYLPGLSGGIGSYPKMFPIILDYRDIGDGYEITIVQLWRDQYFDAWQWWTWHNPEEIHEFEPAGFLEQVQTEIPKMKIVLKNKPDGGFLFYSYEPVQNAAGQ